MACRVFRMVILGVIEETPLTTTFINSAVGHASSRTSGNSGRMKPRHGPYDAGVDTSAIFMRPLDSHSSAEKGPFGVLDIRAAGPDFLGSDTKGSALRKEYSSDNSERV